MHYRQLINIVHLVGVIKEMLDKEN